MTIFSHHQSQSERGGAIVEFALIASFLLLLLMVTFDYGRIFFTSIGVTSAANGLALYAYKNSTNGAIPAELATALARTLSPDLPDLTAETVLRKCKCLPDEDYTPCQSALPNCNKELRITIAVTVSADFKTVAKYPGIPNQTPIRRTATIRVQ